MSILVISCSLNPESRSRVLARAALEELGKLDVTARWVDLRDYELPFCDGATTASAPGVAELTAAIGESEGILVAAPVYNFDVNAAAKNLVELTGRAWTDKPVGFLCAAGGESSYMGVMGLANSLMLDFRCVVVPRFVYVRGDVFERDRDERLRLASEEIRERIVGLVAALVKLAGALSA